MSDLELVAVRAGERVQLVSPAVGLFTQALAAGSVLVAGQEAGALLALGRAHRLRVPAGILGRIATEPRERVQAPVGYGEVLYELEPLTATAAGAAEPSATARESSSALVLRSPQSGRFYHRAAPGEPPFASAGASVTDGQPIGLIEVMKTFTHVIYRATGGLPPVARVARYAASDGGEVRAGDVLLEFELP